MHYLTQEQDISFQTAMADTIGKTISHDRTKILEKNTQELPIKNLSLHGLNLVKN